MPEIQEGLGRAMTRFADVVVSRVKGEGALSRSIRGQRGPLEEIAREHTDENQGREAQRMLKVIEHYEEVLQDSPEDRQRRIEKLEQALKDRALFLWNTLPQYTKFHLSEETRPVSEILPPPQHPKEKDVDRRDKAGGYVAIDFQELKGGKSSRFELVEFTGTGVGEVARAFRAWHFYLEFQPKGEKPYRQAVILLDPNPANHSEDIFSASLTTHGRGRKRQDARFKFKRTGNEITTISASTAWQPILIEDSEITGWDKYATEVGDRDSKQERREKDALALAITQELFEATEVSEAEIKLLQEGKWTEVEQDSEKET